MNPLNKTTHSAKVSRLFYDFQKHGSAIFSPSSSFSLNADLDPDAGIKFIMKNPSCFSLLPQIPDNLNPDPDSGIWIRIRIRNKKTASDSKRTALNVKTGEQ